MPEHIIDIHLIREASRDPILAKMGHGPVYTLLSQIIQRMGPSLGESTGPFPELVVRTPAATEAQLSAPTSTDAPPVASLREALCEAIEMAARTGNPTDASRWVKVLATVPEASLDERRAEATGEWPSREDLQAIVCKIPQDQLARITQAIAAEAADDSPLSAAGEPRLPDGDPDGPLPDSFHSDARGFPSARAIRHADDQGEGSVVD